MIGGTLLLTAQCRPPAGPMAEYEVAVSSTFATAVAAPSARLLETQ